MWSRRLHPLDRLAFAAGVLFIALVAIDRLIPDAGLVAAAILN